MLCTVKVWLSTPAAKVKVLLLAVKSVPLVALPLLVAYCTVWLAAESLLRVTVKVIKPPSLTETLPTLKAGRSSSAVLVPVANGPVPVPSSRMVPVAVAWAMVLPALLLDSVTVRVSAPS